MAKKSNEIEFDKLSDDVKSFILEENISSEDALTEAAVKEEQGGAMGAVSALLEGFYINQTLLKHIMRDYDKVKNTMSEQGLQKLEDRILSTSVIVKTAFDAIKTGVNSGVVYFNGMTEKRFNTYNEIFAAYDEDGFFIISAFLSDGKLRCHAHMFKVNEKDVLVNSEELSQAEINCLDFVKEYFAEEDKNEQGAE